MKKLLQLMLFTFTTSLVAQSVSEEKVSLSLGSQPCYKVEVTGVDAKIAEDVWEEYVKKYDGKVKKNKKAKEWLSEKVVLSGLNKNAPVDVYFKIDERKDLVITSIAVDRGDAFVGSMNTPEDAKMLETIAFNYGVALKKKGIEKEMKEQEKMLEDLRKDLEKLEKKNAGYHDDIKDAQEKIRKAEENIVENLKEQDTKREEIDRQIKAVEEVVNRYNNVGKN